MIFLVLKHNCPVTLNEFNIFVKCKIFSIKRNVYCNLHSTKYKHQPKSVEKKRSKPSKLDYFLRVIAIFKFLWISRSTLIQTWLGKLHVLNLKTQHLCLITLLFWTFCSYESTKYLFCTPSYLLLSDKAKKYWNKFPHAYS